MTDRHPTGEGDWRPAGRAENAAVPMGVTARDLQLHELLVEVANAARHWAYLTPSHAPPPEEVQLRLAVARLDHHLGPVKP
jgi:hypothetical protein